MASIATDNLHRRMAFAQEVGSEQLQEAVYAFSYGNDGTKSSEGAY